MSDLYQWTRLGSLPREGWFLMEVEDLGEPDHECQACGYPEVRYVHHIEHPAVKDHLAVGCVCSGHLTDDHEASRAAERKLRNRSIRLRRLLDLDRWRTTKSGNRKIKYRGHRLVLYPSRYADGWRINVDDWLGRRTHPTSHAAIISAFTYLDPPRIRGPLRFPAKGMLTMKDWRTCKDGKEKYGLYLASREWAILRESVKDRSYGLCERCRSADGENVHHQTYDQLYAERLEDLVYLCRPCHEFVSGKRTDDPMVPRS
jgi:hypothetical protein